MTLDGACIRYTELPGTSRLFADFVYRHNQVSPFYSYSPMDADSYRKAAADIDFPDDRRAALVNALSKANPANPSLEILAKPGTVAVVTGQQVGLFSGPAYTIYKALTAAKLARNLTEQGTPAVPIFWLATEDHDYAEVNHAWTFDIHHKPSGMKLEASHEGRPVGPLPVDGAPVAQLRESLAGFPYADELASLVENSYRDGATFSSAFRTLLEWLLHSFDILYLDPLDPAIRDLAAPFLAKAVESGPEISSRVLERNKVLDAAGYHAQVHFAKDTSFFFMLEGGQRQQLRRGEAGYFSRDRRYSESEMIDRAAELSPNALLRPVMQDWLLPTGAYIGGPAEVAYLAQSEPIYRTLLGRMPVTVNRSGFTVLDSKAARLMNNYKLHLTDMFHGEQELRERMAKAVIPGGLADSFAEAEIEIGKMLDSLTAGATALDPTLKKALDRSRSKMLYQLSKMRAKTARETLRKAGKSEEDAAYLLGLIYPNRHLQERYYTILPLLARHGLAFLDRLYDSIHLDCPDHQIVLA